MIRIITFLILHGLVCAQDKLVTSTECGTSKGCYQMPANCKDADDCDIMVTWKPVSGSNSFTFEILGKVALPKVSSVAIGFSKDEYMGDDDVWSCSYVGGDLYVAHSYNEGKHNNPVAAPTGPDVTDEVTSFYNSVVQCRFTLPKTILIGEEGADQKEFDLDEDYYLLIPLTGAIKMGDVVRVTKHMNLPYISPDKIDFNVASIVTGVAKRPILLKCHASLMIFGWIGCASIAIILAKYFKIMWPNSKLCGEKVWFAMHRFFMIINVLCFVAGFVVIFVFVGGFVHYRLMTQPVFIHAACGISATALGITNPLLAVFRPHPGTKNRPYFNWAHWAIGTSAYILAVACVFLGIDLTLMDLPEYAFWIMVGYVLLNAVTYILLKLVIGVAENGVARKKRIEQYEMQQNKRESVRQLISDEEPTPPGSSVATFILSIHAIGVMGVASALVIIIALM
ncbi:putative ferric-chelate reductase 1 [Ptychodera flava]|uniref:putative ferric-chelate reductase 1 n=1 Tax=Ptychodera flava TaxID=63121 RepID=UPI00396A563F